MSIPGPAPSRDDPDVALGLALRAVRNALLILVGSALFIGLVGAGAAAMSQVENGGQGAEIVVPGLVVLMVGQLAALAACAVTVLTLTQLLRGRVPRPSRALRGLSRGLGLCVRGLMAGVVVAIAIWILVRPSATLSAVLGAVVALQVAVVIGVVRSRVLAPAVTSAD